MSPGRHRRTRHGDRELPWGPIPGTLPGRGTRNGMPEPGGYRWNGGLADPRTPREIVADLHAELAARRRQAAPPPPAPPPPPPAPARRCPACGYLTSAPGHHVTCATP